LYSLWSVTSDLQHPSPLTLRGVDNHEATFVVNTALVANQWKNRAWILSLQPPINHG